MIEIVERVAEALFEWDTEEHPDPCPTWGGLSDEQREVWRSGARAAMDVMAEPEYEYRIDAGMLEVLTKAKSRADRAAMNGSRVWRRTPSRPATAWEPLTAHSVPEGEDHG